MHAGLVGEPQSARLAHTHVRAHAHAHAQAAVEKDKDACDMGTVVENAAVEMRGAFGEPSLFKLDQSQGVQGHACHNSACNAKRSRTAVCCFAVAGRHCELCGSRGKEKGCGLCGGRGLCCSVCCVNPRWIR